MRPIARNRQPIDDQDPPELRAIFAELTVRHPRKEAAKRGETPKEGYDDNTEVVFLGGEYLTRGSQYGFVNHVARWLYTYDYRAGQGLEVADLAIEVYTADCGCAPHLLVAARIERARIRAVYRAEPTRVFKPGDVVRLRSATFTGGGAGT